MEHFEQKSLNSIPYSLEEWKIFFDHVFGKWSDGKDKLKELLTHMNSLSNHVKLAIEVEKDRQLPFIEILLFKKYGKLSSKVYRKKTHIERYLHANSHHHPKIKYGIIKTLNTRASRISNPERLNIELKHL